MIFILLNVGALNTKQINFQPSVIQSFRKEFFGDILQML